MSIFMIKTHKLKMLQPMCNYTVIYFFWECNTHNVFNLLRRNVVLSLIYSTGRACLTSFSRAPGLRLSWRGSTECRPRPWTPHMWTWGPHMGSTQQLTSFMWHLPISQLAQAVLLASSLMTFHRGWIHNAHRVLSCAGCQSQDTWVFLIQMNVHVRGKSITYLY